MDEQNRGMCAALFLLLISAVFLGGAAIVAGMLLSAGG
jgi:hypothetical protein